MGKGILQDIDGSLIGTPEEGTTRSVVDPIINGPTIANNSGPKSQPITMGQDEPINPGLSNYVRKSSKM